MTILVKDGFVISANDLDTSDHLADGVNRFIVTELPIFSPAHDITYPNGVYVYTPKVVTIPPPDPLQEIEDLKLQLVNQEEFFNAQMAAQNQNQSDFMDYIFSILPEQP